MLKQFVLIVALLICAARADAQGYTDVYYDPAESGWGVFLVQSDATQFLAFFVYGTDNKPTWYTAQLAEDAEGNYNGQLYATTGTYFGLPWNPAQLTVATAGTVSFVPTDSYHATVTYALTGGPTVTKTVRRQTLTPHVLAGNYSGSMSGTITGCAAPADNECAFPRPIWPRGDADRRHGVDAHFTFIDTAMSGLVCTVTGLAHASGPAVQAQRTIQLQWTTEIIPTGAATIDSYHPTGQGIEGRLTTTLGDGCKLSLHFAAVLNN